MALAVACRHSELSEGIEHLLSALVALLELLERSLGDNLADTAIGYFGDGHRLIDLLLQDFVELAFEGEMPGAELEEEDTDGIDIGGRSLVIEQSAHQLRGGISRLADEATGHGELVAIVVVAGKFASNAQVNKFNDAVFADDDVGGVDVAMDISTLMQDLERLEDTTNDSHGEVFAVGLI